MLDAPNVNCKAYGKEYLTSPVFRPYSFININCGREEVDEVGHSVKNMVEVAVLMKIVQNLYQGMPILCCVSIFSLNADLCFLKTRTFKMLRKICP